MFFKLVFVFAAFLCLSKCKPTEEYEGCEDLREYDEFCKAIVDFVNDLTKTIEIYLNPIFALFSMIENGDANMDSLPFEIERVEENGKENEDRGEVHENDFDLELVIPIPTEGHPNVVL